MGMGCHNAKRHETISYGLAWKLDVKEQGRDTCEAGQQMWLPEARLTQEILKLTPARD